MDSVCAHVTLNWFVTNKGEPIAELYGKLSPEEYVEDLEKKVEKRPQMPCGFYAFLILHMIGAIILLIVQQCVYPKKERKYLTQLCADFNDKYEKSRGVHLELAKIEGKRRNGSSYLTEGFKLTVQNPGVELPGVKVFTPCKESALAIQVYKNANQRSATTTTTLPTTSAAPGYDFNKPLQDIYAV